MISPPTEARGLARARATRSKSCCRLSGVVSIGPVVLKARIVAVLRTKTIAWHEWGNSAGPALAYDQAVEAYGVAHCRPTAVACRQSHADYSRAVGRTHIARYRVGSCPGIVEVRLIFDNIDVIPLFRSKQVFASGRGDPSRPAVRNRHIVSAGRISSIRAAVIVGRDRHAWRNSQRRQQLHDRRRQLARRDDSDAARHRS